MFKPSKWTKLVLAMVKRKTIFYISFLNFAFKQAKEQILPQVQPFKMLNKTFLCADISVTGKIF